MNAMLQLIYIYIYIKLRFLAFLSSIFPSERNKPNLIYQNFFSFVIVLGSKYAKFYECPFFVLDQNQNGYQVDNTKAIAQHVVVP